MPHHTAPPPPYFLHPIASQGAWGTPGRSGADLLRSSADPPFPSSQQNSNRVDARNASSSTPPKASSTTTDTAVLPGVPLSATAVGALVEMGIKESWAAAALRRCGGSDIARAVEFSFSHDMESLAEEDAASHASTAQVCHSRFFLGCRCGNVFWGGGRGRVSHVPRPTYPQL